MWWLRNYNNSGDGARKNCTNEMQSTVTQEEFRVFKIYYSIPKSPTLLTYFAVIQGPLTG